MNLIIDSCVMRTITDATASFVLNFWGYLYRFPSSLPEVS